MDNIFERLFVEPFQRFYENIVHFMPKVLAFVLILVGGLILGKLLKSIALVFFRFVKVDKLSERTGINSVLQRGGLRESLSSLLSRMVGWTTVFVFIVIALSVLEVPEIGQLLGTFFLYLPNVLAAGIIIFIGYLLSNFLGRAALITCVNAEVPASGMIGRLVKLGVFVLATTMALEQLGIGKETIIVSFSIIFGGIVLALSLAFGLGGKDVARDFIEKKIRETEEKKVEEGGKDDEITHI